MNTLLREFLLFLFFVFPSHLLSSPYISKSLPFATAINHCVTQQALPPPPHCTQGACLQLCHEETFAFSSLVESCRIVHTRAARRSSSPFSHEKKVSRQDWNSRSRP